MRPELSGTVVLDCIGPGLLVVPGLGFVGMAGSTTAAGVGKYTTVVGERPAVLSAATFQRYVLPAVNVAVSSSWSAPY